MSTPTVTLLSADGKTPLMSSGAHKGASFDRQIMSWAPQLRSADADLLPDINTLTARAHDLSRNNAFISGAEQIQLDNIIGSGLRLSSKPDWRLLGQTAEWAAEWSRDVEARFRSWSEDPDNYIDAGRRMNFNSILGLAYRQYLTTGEILATAEWLPGRGSTYSTAIQMVDPARLSNPSGKPESARLRGGVEMDGMGAPIAYHIRSALQSDARFLGTDTYTWKRVKSATKWGRAQAIHIYEQQRPGQTRAKTGLATVLAKSKMLEKFQDVSLEAAIVNAMYAAFIETDFNYAQAADLLGADEIGGAATNIASAMSDFHSSETVKMDGVKIPHLYPGERLNFTSLNHPGPNFAEFEKAALRYLAAGQNVTYEQLARDYSETNYSGARAGLMEAWKFFTSRRKLIGAPFARQIFALWLEEDIDKGGTELPPGAPDFYEAKSAYTRSKWIGPGKDHIDPLKGVKALEIEMKLGLKTMEEAVAEYYGGDWEENLEQIDIEKKRLNTMGVQHIAFSDTVVVEPEEERNLEDEETKDS